MAAAAASIKESMAAGFTISETNGVTTMTLSGAWTVKAATALDAQLDAGPAGARTAAIDLSQLTALDTAGAWLIHRTQSRIAAAGGRVALIGGQADQQALIAAVAAADRPAPAPEELGPLWRRSVEAIGRSMDGALSSLRDGVAFMGLVLETLARSLVQPWRFRLISLVYHMEQAGLNAVPIVALMSFLIGAVLAYQGAEQLQRFGAEPFTVNLVAISVLREIGILLTAIMVAGRSGSAFTAQIGSMKMREEIDAIRTLGLDPVEILVLPRILALVLTAPLLGFLAAMAGLTGGGLVCWSMLDLSPATYSALLREAVEPWSFWVGIIKAPVFAFLIGVIGCFEGMRVTGTAESVGQRTTQSVVEGIFTVIIADAIFSILFVELGI